MAGADQSIWSDDRVERELAVVDDANEPGVSMDVLLQVTLPFVLILAFLVVTEVQTLTTEIERLQKDVQGTAIGRLARERDVALLELQEQLLLAATHEVGTQARGELGVDRYALLQPSVSRLLAGDVDAEFVAASQQLHAAFGDETARRITEERLRAAVEGRFAEMVGETSSLDGDSRGRLLEVSAAHRESFEAKLRGQLEQTIDAAAATQLDLMLRWINDPEASRQLDAESLSLWHAVAESEDAAVGQEALDAFVDLKARHLADELERLGAPLLDSTRRQAGL